MAGVRIVTDSACDLLDETLTELGIGLVPLRIRFGDEELLDRQELSTKEFWARCASSPDLPSTAAPSPGQFQAAFEEMADAGASGVVCINLSSKMSATIQSAHQAAETLAGRIPVRVVDSLTVTLGIGLVVTEAARAAESGAGLDEVVEAAERAVGRLKLYGAIDTLENLKKGGRIGGAQALLGSMLSIKPVIEVRDGVVEQESKQRTRSRSLQYLADKVRAAGPVSRLAVFSADAPDLDEFLRLLEGITPTDGATLFGDVGPVIGSHAGRGAIGVAWIPA
ncbi:MAG TPA: DegV family protein [Acidimicrobiales bacterium]|nr:DegV family protein [Acidimicrobiales bacterium]